jgi:hypothetical protein
MTTKSKPARLTILEARDLRICPNCGGEAKRKAARGPTPTFCSKQCQLDKAKRDMVRGGAIITLAQAWRINRGSGEISKEAFAQLCEAIDTFNAEDAAVAGRPRADLYAGKLIATGTKLCDRRRNGANYARKRP